MRLVIITRVKHFRSLLYIHFQTNSMQTLTFTQKLLRQRRFLSSLIPLFALFLGLGTSQSAMAGIIISNSTVTISRNGAANEDFTTAQFDTKRLGTYDINTGQLLLNGGSFTATATSTTTLNAGFIDYTVADSLGNAVNSGSIQLTGSPTTGSPRSFTYSTAGVNLLSGITTAGVGYNVSVSFRATGRTGINNTTVRDDNSGSGYNAFFNVTGVIPPPSSVTFSGQSVTVDQGNGSVNYPGTAFNTKLIDQKTGSTTTPAFDINTGQLILKGGTVTTTETGTFVVNGATLDYILYDPSFVAVTNGTLQLTQTGATNGVRNFSLTTGTTNLISLVAAAGNGYTLQVSFHATYQVNGTGLPQRANDSNSYAATFDVAGNKTPAPTLTANTITFDPNGVPPAPPVTTPPTPPTPNDITTFNINPSTPRPFQNADLSDPANNGTAYDVNTGQLFLNGTSVTTTQAGTNDITSVILYYRTRLINTAGGAFQPITLTQSGATTPTGEKTFVLDPTQGGNTISQPNLIATPAVTAAGTYVVDVYYQANGTKGGTPFTITDPPTASNYYSATFTVTGAPVQTTIWTGGKNDNWFDAANWSAGIPTATTNALVRDLGAGNNVPYPNINSDVVVNTPSGAFLYSNVGSGPAVTRNFTMGGSSQASRSIARLVVGKLKVYGDFNNLYDSYIQRENTVIEFAGVDQLITGGSFVRADISGGGTKTLSGLMNVSESLNFLTAGGVDAGILATNIKKPTVSLVFLADRAPTNFNNGAQLNGETDVSFLYGFVRTTRQAVLVGETRTYGNVGLTITFDGTNNPGNVEVTRNTVESYTPLNNRFGIRRIFGVRPSDAQTTTGGLTATLIFHYRDSETMNLNGPSTIIPGTSSIPENRLTMFVSSNAGNTFQLVGRDGPVDETGNNVTRAGVRTFATFTLGDQDNPLPVRLTAFDAKRVGADALVTWQTAAELNSKGYDVQVSTNGKEFRTLSSVPSASPNSVKVTSYSYLDTEKSKAGTRYYRLRQVDLDGKETFFSPVAVSFEGKAPAATMVAYPNPFNSNDQLHVALQSSVTGKGQLLITDLTGRTIRNETVEVSAGLTDFAVNNTAGLQAGMYLVKFTLPTGEVKNLKVQKQ